MTDFKQFTEHFKMLTGIDLEHYNKNQIQRRLNVFRQKYQFHTLPDLLAGIEKNAALRQECIRRLTINVTGFFRDPEHWQVLKNYLREMGKYQVPVRLWSAGCATGEEAYSLAWLAMTTLPKNTWELLASDLDADVLNTARAGVYTAKAVKGVDAKTLPLMFQRTGSDLYSVKPHIRERVRFFRHDLLRDQYPFHVDVILCRNVLIYFIEKTKKKVISNLAQALNPGGILFLGSSEQIIGPDKYGLVNENVFFYRKK